MAKHYRKSEDRDLVDECDITNADQALFGDYLFHNREH